MQWRSNRGDGYRPRSKSEGYLQMPSSPALNVDFRPRAPALSARPSSGVAVAHLMHRRLKTRVLSQPRRPSRRPERGRGAHSGRDGTSEGSRVVRHARRPSPAQCSTLRERTCGQTVQFVHRRAVFEVYTATIHEIVPAYTIRQNSIRSARLTLSSLTLPFKVCD